MEFGSAEEALEFAIGKEKEAVEFYKSLAEEAPQASLKDTFVNFSKEEEKHVSLLSDMNANKDKIESYEFKKITDLKISDYMLEIEYKPGMPMPEILKLAMKREEKAVLLYSALANHTENAETKKVFMILVQEESKHKNILEKMYDDYLGGQDN